MKKILGILLIFLMIGLLVLISKQPTEFQVQRSLVIDKSAATVYLNVIDLKKWKLWSPWIERDPIMKLEYSEDSIGTGASVLWDSKKEGKGKQTITDSIENETIKFRMEFFKPFTGVSFGYFRFKELSDVQTEVIWLLEAKNNGFMDKFFYLIMNIPEKIGQDFEKGLKNLKKSTEV